MHRWMIMFTRCMTNCTGNRILIFPLRKPFWSIWRFCGQKLISRLLIGMSWELFHMIPIGTVLQQNRRRQFNNSYVLPLPVLRTRAGVSSDMPPAPRRAAPDRNVSEVIHLAFTHATNQMWRSFPWLSLGNRRSGAPRRRGPVHLYDKAR